MTKQRYVVMGVSGSGKSLIGANFAHAIGAQFVDGDALHPDRNIAKMARGEPLNDEDRWPWLDQVGEQLAAGGMVVACSALRRVYRERIVARAGGTVTFLYLRGRRDTLLERMQAREGHFMPTALLDSQLATLEEPTSGECAIIADIEGTPSAIVSALISRTKDLVT